MPVAHDVLRHAADSPERVAVRGPLGSLTYGELAEKVHGGARQLKGRGALVAIALADPVELLAAVLAADLAGATPLVGDHTWSPERWARATRAAGADLRVTEPVPYAPGPRLVPDPGPEDRAWACFTSGSTGRPRAVVRTRASWTGSFPHLGDLTGIGPGDAVLVPGPLASSLYGFAAVHTLAAGATALVPGHRPPAALVRAATAIHLV
ncbi:MAG: AMP-binding protein, partial [Nonomuraea sp.]|nr:AMP-binding protein [Nonomuraea sp.]